MRYLHDLANWGRRRHFAVQLFGKNRMTPTPILRAAFFRRLFKRTTGLAPGAYRKRFRIPEFARPSQQS